MLAKPQEPPVLLVRDGLGYRIAELAGIFLATATRRGHD